MLHRPTHGGAYSALVLAYSTGLVISQHVGRESRIEDGVVEQIRSLCCTESVWAG